MRRSSALIEIVKKLPHERAVLAEATCLLDAGEGLLLMSDGITQAGQQLGG